MEKATFKVGGMSCGHCKMAVENELKAVEGVASAAVNLQAGEVTVEFDSAKTSVDAMKAVVSDAGYEA